MDLKGSLSFVLSGAVNNFNREFVCFLSKLGQRILNILLAGVLSGFDFSGPTG